MKKTFVITVEYPDNDVIPSDEIMEVTKESFEYLLSRYFGANIMDGDYDRIKVKEATDFIALVKRMREAEEALLEIASLDDEPEIDIRADKVDMLKREVDEYLKRMEL